jgi:hypothetical protein
MLGIARTRNQVASKISHWYVLRWGKKFTVGCMTQEEVYKLQERGFQLGERVCDSRPEAEGHMYELQERARRFEERSRVLVWEFASVLNRLNPKPQPAEDPKCSGCKSISQQFDAALSHAVFNGFHLN